LSGYDREEKMNVTNYKYIVKITKKGFKPMIYVNYIKETYALEHFIEIVTILKNIKK